MKQYLEVGRIVGTHGIRGELRVQPWADSGEFLLDFDVFYLEQGAAKLKVEKSRVHKNIVIVKLAGIDTVEQADAMRSKVIFIDRKDAKLPKGRYFVQDLIGMRVLDAKTGDTIGELADVYNTVANDVYLVRVDGKEYLIPAIDEVLAGTDIEAGTVSINVMKGMFDDED